ncbi:hypothetical protein ACFZB9_30590 [Kitasatospora sp. NPDC008050]|uniref:hypothetical protein n=1 Tax=Kitasatospora sp. NPDC008050 TaxID=3364021 RepID=UPI0036F10978
MSAAISYAPETRILSAGCTTQATLPAYRLQPVDEVVTVLSNALEHADEAVTPTMWNMPLAV